MQWLFAIFLVEVFNKEKRQTGKVIAMQVAQENDVQPTGIKAELLHCQQRCRAAVQQEQPVRSFDQISTLITAAATKCITAAEYIKFHFITSTILNQVICWVPSGYITIISKFSRN